MFLRMFDANRSKRRARRRFIEKQAIFLPFEINEMEKLFQEDIDVDFPALLTGEKYQGYN